VVMRAMAKDPQQRFPSIQDFAAALEQVCLRQGIISPQTGQSAYSVISTQAVSGAFPPGNSSQLTFLASVTDQGAQPSLANTPVSSSVQSRFTETTSSQDFQSQETRIDPQESQLTFIKTPQTFTALTPTSAVSRTSMENSASQPLPKTVDNASEEVVRALRQATHTNKLLIMVSVFLLCVLVLGGGAGLWYFTRFHQRSDAPPLGDQVANPYASHIGKLALNDPLSNNRHQWDDGHPCSFRDGSYHIDLPMNQFATCYAHSTDYRNFVYEVQMTFVKIGHTSSAAGISFRGDNAIPATYRIVIFPHGKYSFLACSNTCSVVAGYPQQPQVLPSFHTGLGQPNVLAVVARDSSFTFYVNGQQVFGPVQDHTSSHGMIGVYAQGGQAGSGTEVTFRNARVWQQ